MAVFRFRKAGGDSYLRGGDVLRWLITYLSTVSVFDGRVTVPLVNDGRVTTGTISDGVVTEVTLTEWPV